MYLGVDYDSRMDSAYPAFKAKGVGLVIRYLCPLTWPKCLTADETRAISEAGFNIASVWETSGGDPAFIPGGRNFFTKEKGAAEGRTAFKAAQAAGQPLGTAIYFAVDYNAPAEDMPFIAAYMDAAKAEIPGYELGVYGGYNVIDYFADKVKFLWQTYAWSGGKVHPKAQLYQFENGVNLGGDVDLNKCFADPGWWRIGGVITPKEWEEAKDVPLLRLNEKGSAVSVLQALLNAVGYQCPVNGTFDLDTLGAVKGFQRDKALSVDGVVGPMTWGALSQAPVAGKDALAKLAQIRAIIK